MFAKFTPTETRDLNRALRNAGQPPRFPEFDRPVLVPLTAAEARELRDCMARLLLWIEDAGETARIARLAADLFAYSREAAQMAMRVERRLLDAA